MRLGKILLASMVVVTSLSVGSASADAPAKCRKVRGVGIICDGQEAKRSPVLVDSSSSPTTTYPFREHWRPVLATGPDGETCIAYETVRLDREPRPDEDSRSEAQLLSYLRAYSVCPDAPALPTTTPAMEAAAFFRQITLPVPVPYVQPDALPVGFEAFLETGSPTGQTFGPVDTPFGPLTLTATAQIYVDWDDPHDDVAGEHGPYTGQPGPHPNGEITHVYQHHGVYDIAVRYVWTATWAIGDITGTIEGAETSGSYPDPGFEAYSREAVGR